MYASHSQIKNTGFPHFDKIQELLQGIFKDIYDILRAFMRKIEQPFSRSIGIDFCGKLYFKHFVCKMSPKQCYVQPTALFSRILVRIPGFFTKFKYISRPGAFKMKFKNFSRISRCVGTLFNTVNYTFIH